MLYYLTCVLFLTRSQYPTHSWLEQFGCLHGNESNRHRFFLRLANSLRVPVYLLRIIVPL